MILVLKNGLLQKINCCKEGFTQESIDRHRFAERVDEIIQLYMEIKPILIKDKMEP